MDEKNLQWLVPTTSAQTKDKGSYLESLGIADYVYGMPISSPACMAGGDGTRGNKK